MNYLTKNNLFSVNSFLRALPVLGSLLASTIVFHNSVAQAQVSLAPMVIELKANRGQSQAVINVNNTSQKPFRARIYAEPFTYEREKGFTTLPSSPSNLNPYLQFSPRELEIPPGVSRRVRLNVSMPPNLTDTELRSIIFTEPLQSVNRTDKNGSFSTVVTRIGVAVFVRQGDVSPKIQVDSARWNAAQKQIQLLVGNTGKASTYLSGVWSLNQQETTIKKGEISPSGMMPDTERNLSLQYDQKQEFVPPPGKYKLTGTLNWLEEGKKNSLPFSVDFVVPPQNASNNGK